MVDAEVKGTVPLYKFPLKIQLYSTYYTLHSILQTLLTITIWYLFDRFAALFLSLIIYFLKKHLNYPPKFLKLKINIYDLVFKFGLMNMFSMKVKAYEKNCFKKT